MDYGTLISKLKLSLHVATHKAYIKDFGTPFYFQTLNLNVHRAFNEFSDDQEITKSSRGKFLNLLRTHCVHYKIDKSTTGLSSLFYTLPDEFNVRGKWTSE